MTPLTCERNEVNLEWPSETVMTLNINQLELVWGLLMQAFNQVRCSVLNGKSIYYTCKRIERILSGLYTLKIN